MLDFYLIQDHQPAPEYPKQNELPLDGELDFKSFENLQTKYVKSIIVMGKTTVSTLMRMIRALKLLDNYAVVRLTIG